MKIFKMMIFFIAFAQCSILLAVSKLNYDIGAIYKNRTLTLGLTGNLDHHLHLWGEKNLLLKGSLDTNLNIFTAGVSNILDASFQFFPLSILGIGGGAYWNQSSINSLDIKACKESIQCTGIARWIYAKASIQAQYQSLIFRSIFKHGNLTHNHRSKPFFESSSVLVAPSQGSFFQSSETVLAFEMNSQWKSGLSYLDTQVLADHSHSKIGLLFARYTPLPWDYFLGLGLFSSPVLRRARSEKIVN